VVPPHWGFAASASAVVPFDEEDEPPFVGLLQVELPSATESQLSAWFGALG
jgi:hypothetical protein